MPEHDIVKHTKAIYDTVKAPGKTWKHKIADILVEIFIIVFAITYHCYLKGGGRMLAIKAQKKNSLLACGLICRMTLNNCNPTVLPIIICIQDGITCAIQVSAKPA